jgi:glycosyltransferase involved in cell wall biosynthesis
LAYRFAASAKVHKIERTLAFYRIHAEGKTAEWSSFLVELYRFSRDRWPHWRDPEFRRTRGEFVTAFMRREWPFSQRTALHRVLYWTARKALAACVTLRLANPEAVARACRNRWRPPAHAVTLPAEIADAADPVPAPSPAHRPEGLRYSALFCGFFLPQYPGISGGEIRDFHLMRHLLGFCRLTFVASHPEVDSGRADPLSPNLEEIWRPADIAKTFPQYVRPKALARMQSHRWQILDLLRRHDVPVFGPELPRDVSFQAKIAEAYLTTLVEAKLRNERTDFLFVSPQVNPLGLLLDRKGVSGRMILLTYDLEAVRFPRLVAGQKGMKRAAGILEAKRACAYERRNLAVYDGIVVVSELDRSILVKEMAVDDERVISVENGVDTAYFAYRGLRHDAPPAVLFVGALGYRPNQLAAMRLVERIMPLVWKRTPEAQVWIVGQQPHPDLLRRGDGRRVFVTGKVPSVLPYLHRCRVVCAPIEMGSGTKYKILEALSAGAPVVCTPLALEGLGLTDEHVALGQTDAELAEAVLAAMHDPESAALRAKRGRAVIETTYAWDVVLAKLEPWLVRIAALPRRARDHGAIRSN